MNEAAGWLVGQSIAGELDVALAAASGYFSNYRGAQEFLARLQALPEDWQSERCALFGKAPVVISLMEILAGLAGTMFEADYSRATLPMRELTVEAALSRLSEQAAAQDLIPDPSLPSAERLADLILRHRLALHQELGFEITPQGTLARRFRPEVALAVSVLRDGPQHSRFWHWLDRFYYEAYRPWRQAYELEVEDQQKRLITILGAPQQSKLPPDLSWLSPQNPLILSNALHAAVIEGRRRVFFWAEPFGLFDTWTLLPGWIVVSFAEPGVLYQNFQEYADQIAQRVQALADPTRLKILRLIRHFSWFNTEIATFTGLSRPTVSIHAKILREAGLIRSYPEGRLVRHEIVADEVRRLFRDLEHFLDLPPEEK